MTDEVCSALPRVQANGARNILMLQKSGNEEEERNSINIKEWFITKNNPPEQNRRRILYAWNKKKEEKSTVMWTSFAPLQVFLFVIIMSDLITQIKEM